MTKLKKPLSVFSLVMINVIAIDSLRTLPISAKLGLPLVSYYLLAAIVFFIPVALVAAELATAYPKTGGLYVWVREAFGVRVGFMTIWLQWIYNVVWYPTILAFTVSTLSYLFDPTLNHYKLYLLGPSLGLFWIFTALNCFGMQLSSIISTVGAIIGTILPLTGIIGLGIYWLWAGHPSAIVHASLLPDLHALGDFSLFSGVLFGLLGMEMSAVHAEEVRNPQKDYPKALVYSTMLIFGTLVFASLAITLVVSPHTLNIVSGLMDAFVIFFDKLHIPWMIYILAILITIGNVSSVSTWIIGPTKGLLVAARDGSIPARFAKVNKHGAPVAILITQAILFSLLNTVFVLFKSINAAYWLLSDLSAIMALLVYVFMFAAAIRLRYSQPEKPRPYKIPGGMVGIWLVAGAGFTCCLLTACLGFVPPTQIPVDSIWIFEGLLVGGLFLFMGVPFIWSRPRKRK
ncbi:MAG: APC family permease [Legionellaceae bacterium]|nr:APC family permease [Legionellaceae bacterium]